MINFEKEVLSPAKLNLNLKILEKNDDINLHRIDTTMVKINFCEKLKFSIKSNNKLSNDYFKFKSIPLEQGCEKDEDNTIYKACKLWQKKRNIPLEINVIHDDNVPAGKGFGIESSNAGVTLRILEDFALNRLKLNKLKDDELISMSFKIGSDVPFFTNKSSIAHVSGFGEIIENLSYEYMNFLIAIPLENSSTKDSFRDLYENGKKIHESFEYTKLNKRIKEELIKNTSYEKWTLTGSGSAHFIKNPDFSQIEKSKFWKDYKIVICDIYNDN